MGLMNEKKLKRITFYYRSDMPQAKEWENRLRRELTKRYPKIEILETNALPRSRRTAPNLLIPLGGDGTILEATQRFQKWNPLVFGLNLGHIGFLASVRKPKDFINRLNRVLSGQYRSVSHMLMKVTVVRKGKNIFSAYALNDMTVQSLLGLVDLKVHVEGHPVQSIHGTGVLVATATGSTAYNLSAHGPIAMPDIKCLIITELHDHSIPTPSLIIKRNRTIAIAIEDFRKMGHFLVRTTGETADVILAMDSQRIVALDKGDKILVKKSERLIRFVELEKNYFFKSLQEKFSFR